MENTLDSDHFMTYCKMYVCMCKTRFMLYIDY